MTNRDCRTSPYHSQHGYSGSMYRVTGQRDICEPTRKEIDPSVDVMRPPPMLRVLSVDDWHDGQGWSWNASYVCGHIPAGWQNLTDRKLLRALREQLGSFDGRGIVRVERGNAYISIVNRHTGETYYAVDLSEVSQ